MCNTHPLFVTIQLILTSHIKQILPMNFSKFIISMVYNFQYFNLELCFTSLYKWNCFLWNLYQTKHKTLCRMTFGNGSNYPEWLFVCANFLFSWLWMFLCKFFMFFVKQFKINIFDFSCCMKLTSFIQIQAFIQMILSHASVFYVFIPHC